MDEMRLWFVKEDGGNELVGPFESEDAATQWADRNPSYYGQLFDTGEVFYWVPKPNVEL
jgi:hypothetical protein